MNIERNAINGTILGEPAQCIDEVLPADIIVPDYAGSERGTRYDGRTPSDLIALLEKVRMSRQRVRVVYGNVFTGEAWDDMYERGTIGRSMGRDGTGIPLLVKTSRSMGGEALTTQSILRVHESAGGKVLYSRERLPESQLYKVGE